MNGEQSQYEGECYCGSVRVTVVGPPKDTGYCHCRSCRKWHAAPVNAWSAWSRSSVSIRGDIKRSDLGGLSQRISCAKCGGGVANDMPEFDLTVVYPMTLADSDFTFEPRMHIFYAERVINFNDGLPKFVGWMKLGDNAGQLVSEDAPTGWRTKN